MLGFVLRRLAATIPILLGVSIMVFMLMKLIPGDPAVVLLGPQATSEDVSHLRRALGLDDPIPVQYGRWLSRALRGDLGKSISIGEPVAGVVLGSFRATAMLAVPAIFLATIGGVVAGVISAARWGSLFDRTVMLVVLFLNSMPSFWLGLVLIMIFSLGLGLFPVSGMYSDRSGGGLLDLMAHLVLPVLTLGAWTIAIIARMSRSSLLEVIKLDYVRTARAKGLAERRVIASHALRNALLPVVTVIGLQTGNLLGGAVLTETVFSWPGLGFEMYKAIASRDLPLILGGILLMSAVFVLVNLAVDVLYAYLDPRVVYS